MATIDEGALAWQLVDEQGEVLSLAERHMVYVHLGIQDYLPVITCVLDAMVRWGRTLPGAQIEQLQVWIDCYHRDSHQHLVNNVASRRAG